MCCIYTNPILGSHTDSTHFPFYLQTELAYLSGDGAAIFDGEREEALLDQKVKINATRELLEEENSNMQQKVWHFCVCVCVCVCVCMYVYMLIFMFAASIWKCSVGTS